MRAFSILIVVLLFVVSGCPSGGGGSSSTQTTTSTSGTTQAADTSGKAPAEPAGMDDAQKTLDERLADVAVRQKEELPAELLAEMDSEFAMMEEAGLVENVPGVGEMIGDFTVDDIYGKEFWLGDVLMDQPVVLFTTRGGWCPFCDVTMDAVQEFMPRFTKGGAEVVMLSPQRADLLSEVAEAKGLTYRIISDSDYFVLEELGLAWGLTDYMQQLFFEAGVDVAEMNGNEDRVMLPFPVFYVIDCDGTIKYAHAGTRCTQRPDLREVSKALYDLGYGPEQEDELPPEAEEAEVAAAEYPETFDGEPSLTQLLDEKRAESATLLPAEYVAAVDEMREIILDSDFWSSVADVGQPAPNITGFNLYGDEVELSNYLGSGPLVIVFFRGGWCPFCDLQLQALERYYLEFRSRGAELIAVTPDMNTNLVDDNGIVPYTYDVIWDVDGASMLDWGLAYALTDELAIALADQGVDVAERNAMDWPMLPVPAVYIVDSDGTIIWQDIKLDYTKRADPEDVLAALDGLSE